MRKRSLNARFAEPVESDIKITTIRDKAWPVGVPIMLFSWSGKAYRSPQIDICPIVVESVQPIEITHCGDYFMYSILNIEGRMLWSAEGFATPYEMDDWFRKIVKPGEMVSKFIHRFRRVNDLAQTRRAGD